MNDLWFKTTWGPSNCLSRVVTLVGHSASWVHMRLLSPRELADALGVSESSLKRWVDAGRIRAARTHGGHRKIALDEAMRFIRESGAPIARPELLGLQEIAEARERALGGSTRLFDHLHAGDVVGARGWLTARYLAGETIAELADGPIRDAMHALGELWRHEDAGVFIEHRATDTCLHALGHLRTLVPHAVAGPVALGCAPEGDPYLIPTMLASMVCASVGFRAINLGPETPVSALQHAVRVHEPRLLWISASTPVPSARARAIARFAANLSSTRVIVGGRHGEVLANAAHLRFLPSMSELATSAATLARRR